MSRASGTVPRPIRSLYATALIATAISLGATTADALPFRVNDDVRGMWNSRLVMGAAFRATDPDRQLTGYNNAGEYAGAKGAISAGDDGNLNYRKGDVISAPVVYTTDLELRYRNRFGVYGKARAWYDFAGEKNHVPHGTIANGYIPDQRLDDSDYFDYNQFSSYELMERYVYANWNIGPSMLTARLGHQSINWGESLLHTGINAFNPLNFSALGRPGIRQDSALVPVNRIYSNLITRNGVSIEGFYALGWEESRLPPCGTLGQSVDAIADPGCDAATAAAALSDRQQFDYAAPEENPFLTPRVSRQKPGSGDQYGVSTRYFVEALDTEFGLYYINFHATTPVLDVSLCDNGQEGCTPLDGLTLPLDYREDVQAFALSAATGVRNLAISAELSHFRDLPVQRNFPELIEGATKNLGIYADRMKAAGNGSLFSGAFDANRTQLLLGGQLDLSSAVGLADASLAAEVSGQWVSNLPDNEEERIGRNGNWGAAAFDGDCPTLTRATEGGCRTDGFATDISWGYRIFSAISLPRPARGVDLKALLAWNHDVGGYAVDGSLVEGRRLLNLRLQIFFQRRWFIELGRTWINANTNYDPARDKGAYTIAVGTQF